MTADGAAPDPVEQPDPDGRTAERAVEPVEPQPAAEETKGRPRGRRGRRVATAITLALAVAGGAGFVFADPLDSGAQDTGATARVDASTAVAKVTRGALAVRTLQKGTLGYAGEHKVVNNLSGTLTDLPSVGQVVRQGQRLYSVDDEPVIMLKGSVPVHRDLSWGAEGPDVRQLNSALVALGHADRDDFEDDPDYFGWSTYRALKKLQDDVGVEENGELKRGQAVFVPEREIRVTGLGGSAGSAAGKGSVVVEGSSTRRQVTVDLGASQQSDVRVGDKVSIALPNGKSTPGVVASVGKVAERSGDGMAVKVLIEPTEAKATRRFDRAPVEVSITNTEVKDVLSVPVRALLAQQGGGYAVERVDAGGERRLVPVETGLFDSVAGRVQITGEGLDAGQRVVVAEA
ncbi:MULTISPECIES: hypothetical protein [unclassified Streptomyces]|uniref:hypothetical protein n=1 Tax=Streptomyces sp. NPDC005955 TaxID=3364738 RepID=UPI003673D0BD